MINTALKKVFGTHNDRELKRMRKLVRQVNVLEDDLKASTDEDLAARTDRFGDQLGWPACWRFC